MKFQIIGVTYHTFKPIKIQNNVVLAKCDCCSVPRYAVFISNDKSRIFKYHGYDENYAKKLFSSLVSRFNSQSQVQ
jgi:L-rhamnose mutarotase